MRVVFNRFSPIASSSKSPDALFTSLTAAGLPDTPAAHTFIQRLYERAPRKSKHKQSAESSRKAVEAESKALQSKRYQLLLDDKADSGVTELSSASTSKDRHSKGKRDRHMREKGSNNNWASDEDEDDVSRKRLRTDGRERTHRSDEDEEMPTIEDEEEKARRDREEDIRERDAFAERMRDRDRDKTKRLVEDRSSKVSAGAAAEAAERRRLGDDTEARVLAMPSLREHSRQQYLTKREIQQIELLRREIADEEALFRGMKVTKREQEALDRKKQLLELVEARLKIDDKLEGYQLPEDYFTEQGKIDRKKKESVLYQRYEEAKPKDDQFVTDVDQWEQSQTVHSTFRTGAMDKQEIIEDYEYVFDESQTIQFVMENTMSGEQLSARDKLIMQQVEEAQKRGMLFTYSCLPILFTSFYSQHNRRNEKVAPDLSVQGRHSSRSQGTPSPYHCRRNWLREDHPVTSIPARGRLHRKRYENRMHSTSPCRCHVRRCSGCRRNGHEGRLRSRLFNPLRRLHQRQDRAQIHDGWYAFAGVSDGARSCWVLCIDH